MGCLGKVKCLHSPKIIHTGPPFFISRGMIRRGKEGLLKLSSEVSASKCDEGGDSHQTILFFFFFGSKFSSVHTAHKYACIIPLKNKYALKTSEVPEQAA